MLNTLLSITIVCLVFGVNIVRISGISWEGVSTIFLREDLSTTLERNDFAQYSESPRADTKTDGVSYDNVTVFESFHKGNNNTMKNFSNAFFTIVNITEFDQDPGSNNTTHKVDWTTQPSLFVLNTESDIGQSGEAKQLISKKTADDLIFVFFFVLAPLVALAGCVCNAFNIIVLRKQGLGESTAYYLFAMSLADFTFLVFTLMDFMFASLKNYSYSEYIEWATWMHHDLFNRYFRIVSGRISNYFVTVLSIERFIAVRFPLSIKFTPISKHPKKIITGVFVFVTTLVVPNIFRTEFTQIHEPHINKTIMKYTLTSFHNSNKEFYVYYTYFILTFLRLIPVIAVFFFNLGIIIVLKSSTANLRNMNAGDTNRQVKQIKITRMLVAIAVIFLICILPGLVHSLLTVFHRPYYLDNQNLWAAVHHIYPFFDIINSTVNFIVYIILSEKFSAIFVNTFCRKCKNLKHATASNNREQGTTSNTSI